MIIKYLQDQLQIMKVLSNSKPRLAIFGVKVNFEYAFILLLLVTFISSACQFLFFFKGNNLA